MRGGGSEAKLTVEEGVEELILSPSALESDYVIRWAN